MKELTTITGKKFLFRTEEKQFASVLSGGYIITTEGDFVDIKDNEDHSDIFTNYLKKYLEDENHGQVDTLSGAKELIELNHIVYLGIKIQDTSKAYATNTTDSIPVALILFPSDTTKITPEQAESCLDLLATNKSLFGNYEKVNIQYHNFSTPEDIKEEAINTLNLIMQNKEKVK